MAPEIRIPYEDISDPQTITDVQEREFHKHGVDMHRHEVEELIDDDRKKERILKVRNRKYFIMGK